MTIREFKKQGYYINYSVPTINYYELDLDGIDEENKCHNTSLDEVFESTDYDWKTSYAIMNNKAEILHDNINNFTTILEIIKGMEG